MCAEGILGRGPGAYEPDKVRNAHHMQSNFKQEKAPVPFAHQIARVQYGSIYQKAPGEKANDRSLTPSKRDALDRIKCETEAMSLKQEILSKKPCSRQPRH